MVQKKKQHIVPRIYLKAFIDPVRPDEIPEHIPFEASVWVIEKSLTSKPKRKAPSNILWKSYFYNLDEDINKLPLIEEFLSKIERKYPSILQKISKKISLTEEDLAYIALFMDTLFHRIPSNLDNIQGFVDEVEDVYRHIDQFNNQNQTVSDQFWRGSHEAAKKQMIYSAGIISSLILHAGLIFIVNSSKVTFFSSDNPVTYQFFHIDELHKFGIPKVWTYEKTLTNEKNFLCYCPLTPTIAVISSPLIRLPNNTRCVWVENKDPSFPFSMNILTNLNAESILISHKPKPYGEDQDFAIQFIRNTSKSGSIEGIRFLVYTEKSRYHLNIDKYKRLDNHPLQPEIQFWTKDLDTLHDIAQDEVIEVVHYYKDGIEIGGTRHLRLYSVSLYPDEPSIMRSYWFSANSS
ncbi:MAG: DUF4238 domain-containing protein [Cyanobacteria bacterium P01_D01_bin.156]